MKQITGRRGSIFWFSIGFFFCACLATDTHALMPQGEALTEEEQAARVTYKR